MAVSVLRRYTPPTCTLEIMAQNSPLSRWTDRPVLKNVRFRLSLDGPHRASDQHIRLQGDRPQLEAMCDMVETYVQQMLTQSASQFSAGVLGEASHSSSHSASAAYEHTSERPFIPSLPPESGRSLVPPDIIIEHDSQHHRPSNVRSLHVVPSTSKAASSPISSKMSLRPQGRLKHQLEFGNLETEDSGATAVLSTLELFDLASALDQYRADNLTIPDLQGRGWLGSTPSWMKAAAVLVFAVGISAPLLQVMRQAEQSATTSSDAVMEDQQLSSAERDDLSELAPNSRRDAGIPNNVRGRVPDAPAQRNNRNASPNRNQTRNQPADELATGPNTQPQPSPSDGARANGASSNNTARTTPTPSRELPPELATIPPIRAGEGSRSQPPVASSETTADTDESDAAAIASSPSASRSSGWAGDASGAADAAPESLDARPSAPASTIPQVNEIRDYFEGQWQPPEELERPIEYRLLLNPNGSVQQIDPLGQTARTYSQQVGLPTVGDPFVSPLETNRPARIRLILQPDGQVRTFLESWN